MEIQRSCPECKALLSQKATSCRCGWGVGKPLAQVNSVELCSWTDQGRSCPCRGIINTGGSWYCREHLERSHKLIPGGTGNYPVKPTARSQHMRQWDDWYADWLAKRDKKPLSVEKAA